MELWTITLKYCGIVNVRNNLMHCINLLHVGTANYNRQTGRSLGRMKEPSNLTAPVMYVV